MEAADFVYRNIFSFTPFSIQYPLTEIFCSHFEQVFEVVVYFWGHIDK